MKMGKRTYQGHCWFNQSKRLSIVAIVIGALKKSLQRPILVLAGYAHVLVNVFLNILDNKVQKKKIPTRMVFFIRPMVLLETPPYMQLAPLKFRRRKHR
jgi:hypothetical protein